LTKTRAQLRALLRQQVGDEVRIDGTVGEVTNLIIIEDASALVLVQADDYWNGCKLHIYQTTDGLAPVNESRKIEQYTNSSFYIEMAFSVAPGAGDKYQICVWPDFVFNEIITAAIAEYSKARPYKTTGTFSTSVNVRYFSPPSGVDLRNGDRIEQIRYINASTNEDWELTGWIIDPYQNKIDIGYFASEAKTYTCFYGKPHADFASDSGTITIPDRDEELIMQFCRAQFFLLMARETFDDFGNLKPSKWTRGNVSEDYGSSRKGMLDLHKSEMEAFYRSLRGIGGSVFTNPENSNQTWQPPADYMWRSF